MDISILTIQKLRKQMFTQFIFTKFLLLCFLFGGINFSANAQCDQMYDLVYTNPTCGDNNGLLEIYPDPTGPVYFYQVLTPDGSTLTNATFADPATFDNLAAGDYTLTATDIENPTCPSYMEDFILVNDDSDCTPPCDAIITATNATCGEDNGSVSVQVSTEGTLYTVNITGPNGYNSNASTMGMPISMGMLPTGDYQVTINSNVLGQDCSQDFEFSIVNDDSDCAPETCEVEVIYFNPACGMNNGIIQVIPPVQGVNQYFYQLFDGEGNLLKFNASFFEILFDELPAGDYTVVSTLIAANCMFEMELELINDDTDCTPPCDAEFIIANETCTAGNGSLGIQVGAQDILYSLSVTGPNGYLSNASTMGMPITMVNLSAGVYQVTINSNVLGLDCSETFEVIVEDETQGCLPETCNVEVIFNNPNCGENDGTILVVPPVPGESQYVFELFDMEGNLVKLNASFFEVLFDELTAGEYIVKSTLIANNCVFEMPVELIDDESDCCGGGLVAGSISTDSDLYICTIGDAVIDTVIVERSATAMGGQFAYFVTNSNGSNIMAGPIFDNRLTFEGAMPEVCRVYGVAYCGELLYDDAGGIETVSATDTFALTNWLPVQVYDCSNDSSPQSCGFAVNGTISTNATRTYCLENGSAAIGPFPMTIASTPFQNVVYVVTDKDRSMVLSGPYTSSNFMINADPYGTYRILGIVYDNEMPDIVPGKSLASITSSECYDYTNSLMVYSFNCDNGTQLCDHLQPSELRSESLLEFCTTGDNQINQVVVDAREPIATNMAYFFYAPDGTVLGGPYQNNIFSFEGFGYFGDLNISQVIWEGDLSIVIGQHISSISSTVCHDFSNAVLVQLHDCSDQSICEILDNGKIRTVSPTVVCSGAGSHLVEVEPYDYQSTNYAFIVTNGDGSQIVQGPLPADGNIFFDLSQAGNYKIRGVAYEGELNVPIGQPITSLSASTCYQYTYSIDVSVLDEAGCETRLQAIQPNTDEYTISNKEMTTLDVIANDLNPCNALPVIVAEPTVGTVSVNENGSVNYLPEAGFEGTVEFVYLLCCDNICKHQLVTLNITNEEVNLLDLLVVPNVITPNQDGINDAFTVKGLNNQLANYTVGLTIYDRFGNVLHTDTNFGQSNTWNAQAYNVDLPAGTYFYLLNIAEKPEMTKAGFIELRK